MRKLTVGRTQWAVGNGFFHSGSVSSSGNSVQYVYDCGALQRPTNQTALKREISEYTSRNNRADLVFLSHFDFDHVSGIPFLAANLTIKKFIIPMIPQAERILRLAIHLRENTFVTDGSSEAEFYLAFIADPVKALTDIARGNGSEVEIDVVDRSFSETTDGGELDDNEEIGPPTLISPNALGAADVGPLTLSKSSSRILAHCKKETVWEWRHEISLEAENVIDDFVDELIKSGTISCIADLDDQQVVKNIINNKQPDLIKCYDLASKKIGSSFNRNITSLMLYSGPPATAKIRAYRSCSSVVERAEIGAWNPRPGWLGLGDANLRAAKRVAHINAVFGAQKPLVGTFAPSHHGSVHDWNAKLMDGFHTGAGVPPTIVFGASGAYGHPHGDVLLEINEMGGTTVIVGLNEKSRWTEKMVVFVKP